jgi:hypothetical protein
MVGYLPDIWIFAFYPSRKFQQSDSFSKKKKTNPNTTGQTPEEPAAWGQGVF